MFLLVGRGKVGILSDLLVLDMEFLVIRGVNVCLFIELLILVIFFGEIKFFRLLNIKFVRIFFVSLLGFVNGFLVIFVIYFVLIVGGFLKILLSVIFCLCGVYGFLRGICCFFIVCLMEEFWGEV